MGSHRVRHDWSNLAAAAAAAALVFPRKHFWGFIAFLKTWSIIYFIKSFLSFVSFFWLNFFKFLSLVLFLNSKMNAFINLICSCTFSPENSIFFFVCLFLTSVGFGMWVFMSSLLSRFVIQLFRGIVFSFQLILILLILGNYFWKRWEYQTTWLVCWEICMQVRKQQLELDMEQQPGSK